MKADTMDDLLLEARRELGSPRPQPELGDPTYDGYETVVVINDESGEHWLLNATYNFPYSTPQEEIEAYYQRTRPPDRSSTWASD